MEPIFSYEICEYISEPTDKQDDSGSKTFHKDNQMTLI